MVNEVQQYTSGPPSHVKRQMSAVMLQMKMGFSDSVLPQVHALILIVLICLFGYTFVCEPNIAAASRLNSC